MSFPGFRTQVMLNLCLTIYSICQQMVHEIRSSRVNVSSFSIAKLFCLCFLFLITDTNVILIG